MWDSGLPSAPTSGLFHGTLLSSGRLLRCYLTEERLRFDAIKEALFLAERGRAPELPDHVYRGHWSITHGEAKSVRALLVGALEGITGSHLDMRGRRVVARREGFADWQTLITRVSPLLLVTHGLWSHFGRDRPLATRAVLSCLDGAITPSTLPVPEDATLSQIIRTEGLVDLHVHLNGTTEPDAVRLDAMANLRRTMAHLKEAMGGRSQKVAEQYAQIEEGLTIERLIRRLRFAVHLRRVLAEAMGRGGAEARCFRLEDTLAVEGGAFLPQNLREHGRYRAFEDLGVPRDRPAILGEGVFLWRVFDWLNRPECSEEFARAVHLYVLICAQHQRFTVQQVEQNGFDQFQKITENEFRTLSEEEYQRRFDQVARGRPGEVSFLEGRFAPKSTVAKTAALLSRIEKGHGKHRAAGEGGNCLELGRLELGLVAHFIKKAEGGKVGGAVRHAKLRTELERQAVALLTVLKRVPRFRELVVGADAAANELHAAPEVFAPIFRRLRRGGFTNFTYHAGEDFPHLLSGMRAVWEAVTFLDLRQGNRIGHATALGVDPALWGQRVGRGGVVLERGQWLDDLIFAYEILSTLPEGQTALVRLSDQILALAHHIHRGGGVVSAGVLRFDSLRRAWKLRALDPRLARDPGWRRQDAVSDFRRDEWRTRDRIEGEDPDAFALFQAYHGKAVRTAGRAPMLVTEAMFPPPLLDLIQRATLERVVQRGIVLEAMPTSNLRIGVYRDMGEHHLIRWLGLDGTLPRPLVVMASDDPGIFVNSIHGEYHHLRAVLRAHPAVDDQRICAIVRALNQAGQTYRFHPQTFPRD